MSHPNNPGSGEGEAATFAKAENFWILRFRGVTRVVRDVRGLTYVQYLLRYPREGMRAIDLQNLARSNEATANAKSLEVGDSLTISPDLGDAGEMLDARAKGEYRRRLLQLRDELGEARARGDFTRAEGLESEIDFIAREVSRAVGLGGRDRRSASDAERARVNVTRAIKAALAVVLAEHPALGALLTRSIKTGAICALVHPPGLPMSWQFSLTAGDWPRAPESQQIRLASSGPDALPGPTVSQFALDDPERLLQSPNLPRDALLNAAKLARSSRRDDLLVAATLKLSQTLAGAGPGIVDHELTSLINDALKIIGRADSSTRAILCMRAAVDLYWSQRREQALQLAEEALQIARRIGEPATLIAVLNFRQWMLWGPANLEQRLAIASEMIVMAERAGDWGALLRAHESRLAAMLEMGEIHEVDAEIAAIENVCRVTGGSSGFIERFRVMRSLMRGDLAEAELWLERLKQIAEEQHDRRVVLAYTGQLAALLAEQDRTLELAPMLSGPSSEIPQLPIVRGGMALMYARMNRVAQARAELDYLAADDFVRIPDDWNWLGTLADLAEVAVRIDDRQRAQVIYQLLAQYAGRAVTLGYGELYYNAVSHYLALISAALGEFDRAQREFESALRFNRRMGAAVALAYSQLAYARVLRVCEGRSAGSRSAQLLGQAQEAAEGLGLKALLRELWTTRENIAPSFRSARKASRL